MESIKFQYTQMQIAGENKKYSIDVVRGAQLIPLVYFCIEQMNYKASSQDGKERQRHFHLLAGKLIVSTGTVDEVFSHALQLLPDYISNATSLSP